jgi:drug/metabolite transporter (DMT)-like permease
MGGIGFGVPYCLMVALAPRIPVGIMALALALVPILTYGLSLALSMERFRALRVAGILVGLGGMMLILLPKTSLPEPGMAAWAALALVPSVMFAASLVAAERFYPKGADSLALSSGVLLLAAVYLFPVMLATGDGWFFAAPFDAADGVIVGSTLVIALAWICLVEVIRLAGAVFYSTIAYIESLCGVGFGMLIFGERHSPWVWAATGSLMVGLFLVNRMGLRPGTATD